MIERLKEKILSLGKKNTQGFTPIRSFTLERWRFITLWLGVFVLFLVVLGRAFYVQIAGQDFFRDKAHDQIIGTERTKPMRGILMDRNGVPLAVSSPVMTVFIDPTFYFDQKKIYDEAMSTLSKEPNNKKALRTKRSFSNKTLDLNLLNDILGVNMQELSPKLYSLSQKKNRYYVLKREVSPQDVQKIREMRFVGINSEVHYKRYYPQAQPNAQLIGMTNDSGEGIEGLEKQLNERLTGQGAEQRILRDREGNRLKIQQVIREEKAGENIYLSLDSRLQYVMYQELMRAGIQHRARYASAVAVDVRTGEILAMNTWPSYNPNDKESRGNEQTKRNRGAVDQFEPGSTIKPFSVAMGLSTKKYKPSTLIDTSPGTLQLGDSTIRDAHNYGVISLTNILVKSSNVGVAKIALAERLNRLPQFYQQVGFGSKTSADLLGERAGNIKTPKEWTKPTVGTMSYGYGLDVTLLQLVQGYAMLGNQGTKMPLSIYKVPRMPEGETVIDANIANQVVLMMEKATREGGTGTLANISGYRVAGKTGTARRLRDDGKGYEKDRHRALFAGVAPVSNPRIALVVLIDDPRSGEYYGSRVAAPVFSRIMQESLRLMNVPMDKAIEPSPPKTDAKNADKKDAVKKNNTAKPSAPKNNTPAKTETGNRT